MKHKKKLAQRIQQKQQAKRLHVQQGAAGKHAASASGKPSKKAKQRKRAAAAAAAAATGAPQGYAPASQRVLLLGEGNFSFARALARLAAGAAPGLVATALDSAADVLAKYEEGEDPVSGILAELEAAQARVRYGVDATRLRDTLKANKKQGGLRDEECVFDRVVFNFPHVGLGIKDQDVNVAKNQALLSAFFVNACTVLARAGEVLVTVKTGPPYDAWNLVAVAHHATGGILTLKTTYPFNPDQFPGYAHRRTLGYKEGLSSTANEEVAGRSRTYVFRRTQ